MKILYVRTDNKDIQYGGSVSHSAGIIKAMRKSNVVRVVSSLSVLNPDVLLKPGRLTMTVIRSFRVVWEALRFKPDVIYQRYCWIGFATLFTKAPLILEWNGSDYWMARMWNRRWYWPLVKPLEWLMLKRAYMVVRVSESMKVDHPNVITVPNGVDTDMFRPIDVGKRERLTVGWVGTFGPWHGIQLLAEATKLDKDIDWIFVGDGIEREIFLRSVCANVRWTPRIGHHLMPYFLASCDALVNASQNNADGTEFFGSPTKVFEYMAMGKPVFSTPYGQLKHIIPEAGHFTTAQELVHKLVNIPEGLAEECLRRSKGYTWDKIVERILLEFATARPMTALQENLEMVKMVFGVILSVVFAGMKNRYVLAFLLIVAVYLFHKLVLGV